MSEETDYLKRKFRKNGTKFTLIVDKQPGSTELEYHPHRKNRLVCKKCRTEEFDDEGNVRARWGELIEQKTTSPLTEYCRECRKEIKNTQTKEQITKARKASKRKAKKAKTRQTRYGRREDCIHYKECLDENLDNDHFSCEHDCSRFEYNPNWGKT